ncbi:DUF6582 domain-containing protein [Tunturiibacter psychrotolerans]|uniref:DUF6582 domain-containing protein n=1 Tax=Tunturiibacter psychrotolerans TaxID=3069686 RepID=UPI003D22B18A
MKATWKHHEDNKALDAKERNDLPASVYAFPEKRKEPLNNASHVRNAIARFDQVKDVSDHEREQAFANIKAAAKHYGVEMTETDWHDLGKKPPPPTRNTKSQPDLKLDKQPSKLQPDALSIFRDADIRRATLLHYTLSN